MFFQLSVHCKESKITLLEVIVCKEPKFPLPTTARKVTDFDAQAQDAQDLRMARKFCVLLACARVVAKIQNIAAVESALRIGKSLKRTLSL